MDRTDKGTFVKKFDEEKKLFSFRLTPTAIEYLDKIAAEQGISRTDVIENLARSQESKQQILLRAIQEFINFKKAEWGSNNAQKGEFNMAARTWDNFRRFKDIAENAIWELLGEDSM